jgi:hypothetical protein
VSLNPESCHSDDLQKFLLNKGPQLRISIAGKDIDAVWLTGERYYRQKVMVNFLAMRLLYQGF